MSHFCPTFCCDYCVKSGGFSVIFSVKNMEQCPIDVHMLVRGDFETLKYSHLRKCWISEFFIALDLPAGYFTLFIIYFTIHCGFIHPAKTNVISRLNFGKGTSSRKNWFVDATSALAICFCDRQGINSVVLRGLQICHANEKGRMSLETLPYSLQ